MLYIGSHVSYDRAKGLLGSVEEALSYGANVFMFYTGAPQNTLRSSISIEKTLQAMELMKKTDIDYSKVIVHAPYIVNLANAKDMEKFSFSVRFLKSEVERVASLGAKWLVLHPGSHVGEGVDAGIFHIIQALNDILMGDEDVTILLETMAGKGTEIGRNLDEIKRIIDGVSKKHRIGVCLDTCHLHDAGYDLTKFDDFLMEFDKKIGLSYIKCVHINDSKNEIGSHKDRHENIGFGQIGFDTLLSIIYHKKLEDIPKILETPYIDHVYPPYKKEIEMIREKVFDPNWIQRMECSAEKNLL